MCVVVSIINSFELKHRPAHVQAYWAVVLPPSESTYDSSFTVALNKFTLITQNVKWKAKSIVYNKFISILKPSKIYEFQSIVSHIIEFQ